MTISKHRVLFFGVILIILGMMITLSRTVYTRSLQSPPNTLWSWFSGYYRYDPRYQTPPAGLFGDRPEPSLAYYLDSTLKICGGKYPPLSQSSIRHYEVEEVEYFGYTDYHAFSHLHTRIYFADGTSARVVFRLEAGHNEGDPFLFIAGSTVRAGAWMDVDGLLRDPDIPPPGWLRYDGGGQPGICRPDPPYKIEEVR